MQRPEIQNKTQLPNLTLGNQVRILGIDPGSRIVGYACISSTAKAAITVKDLKIHEAGVLKSPEKLIYSERIGLLHNSLYELLERIEPTVVVIEKAFSGVNAASALRLGEARGALISAARRLEITIAELTPAKVKKSIVGNGRATKEQVSDMLRILCGFERGKLPYDATDALAIALSYGLSYRSFL